jgi:hypothetical protein
MIGVIWSMITGNPIARLLAKVVGIALAIVTFGAWQRRQGAQAAKEKQAEAVAKGVEAGAKGAAKAEADLRAGKTPEDIVRGNDHEWR